MARKERHMLKKIGKNDGYKAVMEYVREADRMVKEYGWQDKTVYPYSWPEKVTTLIDQIRSYARNTPGSKEYLRLLANGLADILNRWEKEELEKKVSIKLNHNGKVISITKTLADAFVSEGLATYC